MNDDRSYHRRLNNFESFDRISLDVVPYFKTSELSGDEWRTRIEVLFYFKGEVVHETTFGDMRSVLLMLGSVWLQAQEPIPERICTMEDEGRCDQPGCEEMCVSRYKIKQLYSRTGDKVEPLEGYTDTTVYYRQFCRRHLDRGDSGRDDSNNNYVLLSGPGPNDGTNLEETPSEIAVAQSESVEDLVEAMVDIRKNRDH